MNKEKAIKISQLIAEIAFLEAAKVNNITWGESTKVADAQKFSSKKQQELSELLTTL